ncbi:MAG: hypothetical protein H0W34_09095 [Pyrinomonadaceae bacterium]|nr:hypothetical protein [Blastocatellia bacterium]MBA3572109.1 hypothetical protein [Pyrinomonadaceae bacterium]
MARSALAAVLLAVVASTITGQPLGPGANEEKLTNYLAALHDPDHTVGDLAAAAISEQQLDDPRLAELLINRLDEAKIQSSVIAALSHQRKARVTHWSKLRDHLEKYSVKDKTDKTYDALLVALIREEDPYRAFVADLARRDREHNRAWLALRDVSKTDPPCRPVWAATLLGGAKPYPDGALVAVEDLDTEVLPWLDRIVDYALQEIDRKPDHLFFNGQFSFWLSRVHIQVFDVEMKRQLERLASIWRRTDRERVSQAMLHLLDYCVTENADPALEYLRGSIQQTGAPKDEEALLLAALGNKAADLREELDRVFIERDGSLSTVAADYLRRTKYLPKEWTDALLNALLSLEKGEDDGIADTSRSRFRGWLRQTQVPSGRWQIGRVLIIRCFNALLCRFGASVPIWAKSRSQV